MDITYYKKYEPIFNTWHIVSEIGEGSYGKVFEIERRDLGHVYKAALKAISVPQSKHEIDNIRAICGDEQSAAEYYRDFMGKMAAEFELMSKLKGHSNIVSYEDHAVYPQDNGIGWNIFIRMELLTPLSKYVINNAMTEQTVVKLGIDICKALELCRKHNIVHRDIKPENIFISENGDFKLGDFGIAKTVEKTMGGLSQKGTYTYMAPETYKGQAYGPSVDIYSLGIVLYRYLNKSRAPFYPDYPTPVKLSDGEAALARRMSGEPVPALKGVPSELSDAVIKACAFNPEDRYSSPTEMREALEAAAKAIAAGSEKAADNANYFEKTASVFSTDHSVTTGGKAADSADYFEKTASVFSADRSVTTGEKAAAGLAAAHAAVSSQRSTVPQIPPVQPNSNPNYGGRPVQPNPNYGGRP
ncbi:MAG: serine/threonine-protein kinase, partial [Bacillota bacterium]|nr:serine/threonine-protein kinase [Bacillota bacterium]